MTSHLPTILLYFFCTWEGSTFSGCLNVAVHCTDACFLLPACSESSHLLFFFLRGLQPTLLFLVISLLLCRHQHVAIFVILLLFLSLCCNFLCCFFTFLMVTMLLFLVILLLLCRHHHVTIFVILLLFLSVHCNFLCCFVTFLMVTMLLFFSNFVTFI